MDSVMFFDFFYGSTICFIKLYILFLSSYFCEKCSLISITKRLYIFADYWKIFFYFFLCIMMHASWTHSIMFFLQSSFVVVLWDHGWNHTFLIHKSMASFKIFSVTLGCVIKIATSIFSLTCESVEKTFSPNMLFSVMLIGTTLYPHSNKSLNTLYPYFSSLLDAPMTA